MASFLLRHSVVVARSTPCRLTRGIAASPVLAKDLVQDLYLREIKGYKAPPTPKDAHVGVVKAFSIPATPQPPSPPSDFAAELASYDGAEPGISVPPPTPSAIGEPAGGAREFLAFLEQDHPKEEEAHH